jgi:hypothetical protein
MLYTDGQNLGLRLRPWPWTCLKPDRRLRYAVDVATSDPTAVSSASEVAVGVAFVVKPSLARTQRQSLGRT